MRIKGMKMLVLSVVLSMSIGSTVFAESLEMPDGNYFDASVYAKNNPDVVAVFGTDPQALYYHYVTCGQAEGRTDQQILPYIDPNYTVTPVDFSLYAVQDAAFYRTFETGQHCYGCYIAGTEIHVIGITSNGYWQVEDYTTGYTYYVAGQDLIASQEEALATYVPTVLETTRAQHKEIYGNGEELSFTNTYTLPNTGITMPCLTGFNTVGLNPYGEWFSDSAMSDIYANHTATFMAGAEQAKMAWDRLEWRTMCYAYPVFF